MLTELFEAKAELYANMAMCSNALLMLATMDLYAVIAMYTITLVGVKIELIDTATPAIT